MAKLSIPAGATSKLVQVFIQDATKADGSGLTGLVFNSAGLTAYTYREGAGSAVAITLATMTLGVWASGGFVVVDGTNMPGLYQLGIPNAAIASGAGSLVIYLKGATNMAPVLIEIELDDANEIADALLDRADAIEIGLTPRQAFRLMASALAGKLSGAATTTIAIRNAVADSKARITATVDADGNRTAITTDVS